MSLRSAEADRSGVDAHLEPSVSRTRPTTTRENHRRSKGLSPEMLNLPADAIVWRQNLLLSTSDGRLASQVGLCILQAAFPLATVTEPVSNRRMDRCTRIEHGGDRQQRCPQR